MRVCVTAWDCQDHSTCICWGWTHDVTLSPSALSLRAHHRCILTQDAHMRHATSHDRGNFLATHCVCHTRFRVVSPCILIHLQVFECVWGYYGLGRSCGAACQYGNPLLGLWEHHYIRRAPHEIRHRFQHELIADTRHVLTCF